MRVVRKRIKMMFIILKDNHFVIYIRFLKNDKRGGKNIKEITKI